MPFAIECLGVTKRFGELIANDSVNLSVPAGTIHGIAGENGAGKSTLMKSLYGLHPIDSGEIRLHGKRLALPSPFRAKALGVGMVHQHFLQVPTLTVWENVALTDPGLSLRKQDVIALLKELILHYGFSVDPLALVENLGVGEQQQVELIKLLYQDSSILILDEPTALLTPQEVDRLFEQLRTLKQSGKTIVLVTHKLRELLSFADRITVLRQGKSVAQWDTSVVDESTLAEAIIGRKPVALARTEVALGEVALETSSLRTSGPRPLRGIHLKVRYGECVGIAGVEGNGQDTLVEVLAGIRAYDGKVRVLGQDHRTLPTYELKQQGVALIPPDRHHDGLVLDFSLWENFLLGHHWESGYQKKGVLRPNHVRWVAKTNLERFGVRPPLPDIKARALSGGNQQKLLFGREFQHPVRLLVASHPTRGVDIGAIEFIHAQIVRRKAEGAAILLLSSELEELLALCDRIVVFYNGAIQGETRREEATETQLGLWMTGGRL